MPKSATSISPNDRNQRHRRAPCRSQPHCHKHSPLEMPVIRGVQLSTGRDVLLDTEAMPELEALVTASSKFNT